MSTGDAWTEEWLKAQKKFVESWSDLAQGVSSAKASQPVDLWSNGFDMWRKTYATPSTEADQVIDKCMDIGKGYFTMAEQIGRQISAGGKPQEVVQQWLEQIKSGLQQQANHWSPAQHQAGHDFMSQWMGPSANWQKMAAAMMPVKMPGSTSGIYGIGEEYDQISQLLSMPGLGFFRESQEKQQAGAKLALDYQQANQKFNASFMQVSIESLQAFQDKLASLFDGNEREAPSSLRAVYDLWVDISEAHYANYAMSEEYQSLYGDMVNKLMALKRHYSELVDETMESLNLPSRKELDTVHQRLQQARRENQNLRRELKEIRSMLANKPAKANKPATKKTVPVSRKANQDKKASAKNTKPRSSRKKGA